MPPVFSKTLLALLVFTLLGLGGFLVIRSWMQPPTAEDIQAKKIKDADYIAAIADFGPLVIKQPINVIYTEGAATGPIDSELVGKVSRHQEVILYDTAGFVLPLGGAVRSVEETDEDKATVVIALPEDTETKYLSPDLEIITLETNASKRMLLNALQQDENGENFIWAAKKAEEAGRYNVTRQYIDKGLDDGIYFEMPHKIGVYDLVIINPDKKIRSDKEYKIHVMDLKAPLHNPIRQAWINFELKRLNDQRMDLNQIANDCQNGIYRDLPPTFGDQNLTNGVKNNTQAPACGASSDPLAVFKSLTKMQE